MVLHLNKLESPSPNDALCQIWLKLAQQFWESNFFNFINVFYLSLIISPLKRAGPFIWTKLNTLHPRMHCANFGWNWPSGSEEDFLNFVNVFCYFVIISPGKRAAPCNWTNLNPLHPRILCAKFGWNWPSGSGGGDENVKSLRQCKRQQGQQRQ